MPGTLDDLNVDSAEGIGCIIRYLARISEKKKKEAERLAAEHASEGACDEEKNAVSASKRERKDNEEEPEIQVEAPICVEKLAKAFPLIFGLMKQMKPYVASKNKRSKNLEHAVAHLVGNEELEPMTKRDAVAKALCNLHRDKSPKVMPVNEFLVSGFGATSHLEVGTDEKRRDKLVKEVWAMIKNHTHPLWFVSAATSSPTDFSNTHIIVTVKSGVYPLVAKKLGLLNAKKVTLCFTGSRAFRTAQTSLARKKWCTGAMMKCEHEESGVDE